MEREFSNFIQPGTTHRDIPATCPKEFRNRIVALREARPSSSDSSWREKELERVAKVGKEIALDDARAAAVAAEAPVYVSQRRPPLSVENRDKLLKWGALRSKIFAAELRYSDDQPRDEKGRFAGGGGTSKGETADDAKSHVAAAKAHMDAADKYDEGDDRHSQDKAQAHFKAAAAHLQAASVHNSKGSSQAMKDGVTKAAQEASWYANKA